ncbi:MAG: PEP-CTERM sorting domain-containing protein [Armatimonadota bacterium]
MTTCSPHHHAAYPQRFVNTVQRLLAVTASVLCMVGLVQAQVSVSTSFGVTATLWTSTNGNMKMDYDWVRDRFVIQYLYGSIPPQYATIDLATKTLTHLAQTTSSTYYETLLTVLPTSWNGYSQGTTLVSSGGTGNIFAISPTGAVSTFTSGLPNTHNWLATPTDYTTVRWDEFGVASNDLFYANEGSGEVSRVDSSGNIVWTTALTYTDQYGFRQQGLPEAMIVLGSNPRWGTFQNKVLVGQNYPTSTMFTIDPITGTFQAVTSPIPGAPESFRLYHSRTGAPLALYVSLYGGGNSQIYQITNLNNIPNLQPDDLFIAREALGGGEVYHVYWDNTLNSFVSQQIASFSGPGYFLEDMVFAPQGGVVPEPSSLLLFSVGTVGVGALLRRSRRA